MKVLLLALAIGGSCTVPVGRLTEARSEPSSVRDRRIAGPRSALPPRASLRPDERRASAGLY